MIKRFISYYKPHIPLFTLDMICALIVALCNLVYPKIASSIVEGFETNNMQTDALITSALILAGVYILKAICQYIVGYYGHMVGVKMQADMRRDLFMKYERLPFSYFDDHKTGDLLSRLTTDLWDVSELAHHGPENLFLAILMFIGSFAILFSINGTLTLIMFAIVPFIILFTIISRRNMSRAMKNSRKQMSEINSTLENSVGGIRETKAYAAEAYEICKFQSTNLLFRKFRGQAMKSLGGFDSIMTFLQDMLYFTIVLVGGLFLYNNEITAADFTAFLL